MVKFYVEIPEVHKCTVEVEAPEGSSLTTLCELAQEVHNNEGSDDFEYSHTLERDKWTARTEKGDYLE